MEKRVIHLPPGEMWRAEAEETAYVEVRQSNGRPTKCTVELLRELATLIAEGVHPSDACWECGITEDNRRRWRKWGREALKDDPDTRVIYAEFVRVYDGGGSMARGVVARKLHRMAAEGNLGASQLWLTYFGKGKREEGDGDGEEGVVIEFAGGNVFGGRREGEEVEGEAEEIEEG